MSKRLYIIIFVCLFCLCSNAQTSLLISVVDSATNEKRVLPRIELINKGLSKVIDDYSLHSEFLIEKLDPGKWTIKYDSYFFNFREIEVDLIPNIKNRTTLYVKDIPSNTKKLLLLDKLKENDSILYILSSNGCFHSWTDTLKIVAYNGKKTMYCRNKSKELHALDYSTLRQFEGQFHLINNDGCTTVGAYRIIYNGKSSKYYRDGSCAWDFGERILEYFFPKPLIPHTEEGD